MKGVKVLKELRRTWGESKPVERVNVRTCVEYIGWQRLRKGMTSLGHASERVMLVIMASLRGAESAPRLPLHAAQTCKHP